MQIRLLGPLEASVDHRAVTLGGAKQRAVLAMLALQANHVVTADKLLEGLWGEDPPASAAKMIQNYVWRLRTALRDEEGAAIVTRGRGYELRIDPDGVDVGRFERLVATAGRAAAAGEASGAAREALALWRGPVLTDVTDEPFAAAEIRRLEDLRVQAAELAIDADLAAGLHHEVVSEIERLVAEHPLREHLHAQRMLALYRCGRQAEALEVYREARSTLVDAVGLEPGAELQRLQDAILRQDPSLDVEPARTELPRELAHAAATPIVGRDRELEWLRARWARARGGNGGVVAVTGEPGSGKTRLAAELATEVHHTGGWVRFVSGWARPEAVVAALHGARQAPSSTLLVIDDPDAAPGAGERLMELAGALAGKPVLVLATAAGLGDVVPESLALAPLDGAAVQRIAELYAPDGGVALAELVADSHGLPGRVHELASERALQAATWRVKASAPRAAAGRSELRLAEHELTGSVVALQIARERLNQVDDVPVACPFKGLAAFGVADAPYFFGRERLAAELVARAVGAPLLGVIGPSGSGKSSVIRAGLLASLAAGVLPGSCDWSQVVIRPGEHPLRELRGNGRSCTVLAVDQFEEIFTTCRDEGERAAFIKALVDRAQAGHGLVVVGIRSDFYGRCAAYPALSSLISTNHVLVGAMTGDERRRTIEGPAQRAGLSVEADLVDALVDDVAGEPGGLPLLSAALLELWEQRDGRALTHAAFVRTGGVRGAVSRLAEDAFGRLDPGQQRLTRAVMLRLAGEGTGGDVVRRRVPLSELEGARDDDLAAVLGVLTERRLLTTSAMSVEVAHEALLREWPRLRGWLREDAEGRRIHGHLAGAARDWEDRGRDPADLYRGARLAVASEWRADHEEQLNPVERAFLDAGRGAAQRANRRLRLALAGVAALLVAAIVGGLVAVHQRATARHEALVADAQRIGLQALSEPQLERSLLLARQAVALDDSPARRSDLLGVLLRAPAVIAADPGTGNPVTALDISPDGRTLAVGDDRGNLLLVDAVTHRPLRRQLNAGSSITTVRFSPDGARLAVAGYTVGDLGFVDLVDVRTPRVRRLTTGFESESSTSGVLATGALAFSPDSRTLAVDFVAQGPPSGFRRYLVRWDARSTRRLGPPTPITVRQLNPDDDGNIAIASERHAPGALIVGFIDGGTRIVTSSPTDGTTDIRDATTLRTVRRFPGAGAPGAVSPDGRVAALALPDGRLRLLDLRSGRARLIGGDGPAVTALRFAPDSTRLLIARGDTAPVVWDVARGSVLEAFPGLANVTQLALSADGASVYGAGKQGDVMGWDLTGARRLGRTFRAGTAASTVLAVPSSGRTFAVPDGTGHLDLIDSRTLRRMQRISAPAASQFAISPDGRTLVTGSPSGAIGFIDLASGRPLAPPRIVHVGRVLSLAYSPDGRWLASAGVDRAVYLWDARRHRTVKLYGSRPGSDVGPPTGLSFNPDGTRMALTIAHTDGTGEIDVLAVPSLVPVAELTVTAGSQTQFSRDGRRLLYRDDSGQVWTIDMRTWSVRGLPLSGAANPGDFALAPDNRTLLTTSADGTAQLWDLTSGRALGSPLGLGGARPLSAAFLADGTALVTIADDGHGAVWDLRPRSWQIRACTIVGRPLTRAEWHDFLPGRTYAPACAHGSD